MPTNYFALTIGVLNASTAAYYSVTPTSNLTISQGGVTFAPTSAAMTTVSIYPQTLQIQAPAGSMSGGVNIITEESTVSGRVMISPPVNVSVVVTLYGNGGVQAGQQVFDPGSDGGVFSFSTSSADAIQAEDAAATLQKLLEK